MNILKNAKFGDKFVTRDGRICLYIQNFKCCGTVLHTLFPETGQVSFSWYDDGKINLDDYESSTQHPSDIISKYKEDIDEAELDELAKESKNYIRMLSSAPHVLKMMTTYEEGFKHGYRKAKEK